MDVGTGPRPDLVQLLAVQIAQEKVVIDGEVKINLDSSRGKVGNRKDLLTLGGEPCNGLQPAYDFYTKSTWS